MSISNALEDKPRYVLVTAAYNEEKDIEKTLHSVVSQSLLPLKWVVVSDGSTDSTDEIVRRYANNNDFIHLHRIVERHVRNFGAQVAAIKAGYEILRPLEFDYFANLDADISFEPEYYEKLLKKFQDDPQLGLGGGLICEEKAGVFRSRPSNRETSVAHAVQLFRRHCYEMIGGYQQLPYGGPDWVAEVSVRQKGWNVRTFKDLPVHHHRPTGSVGGMYRGCYRLGLLDYSVGCHPVFEVGRCMRRIGQKPVITGALVRLWSFIWASVSRHSRSVPDDFVRYLRSEQLQRMRFRKKT